MIPLLRSEFRKLFTIRSTYIISGIALLLITFISFYVMGYKGVAENPELLMSAARVPTHVIAVLISIVAILLMTHEYRYNTIMYTLTSSNSRSKVLLAKILVVSTYVLAFTAFAIVYSIVMARIGVMVKGVPLVPQQMYYWDVIWKSLFYVWANAMTGLLFAALFRHVVGAIVAIFVIPSTVEPLLGLVLKENTKYLPFTALEQVNMGAALSPGKGAAIFLIYLAAGWIVAWVLFLKRDAN
ncbi:MAG: hypothetical protein JWL85_770 [Candidatus Saccharibacteria bacterium]|nr:hypothetical protein [Candidatus Saccharibacteria bacterium]